MLVKTVLLIMAIQLDSRFTYKITEVDVCPPQEVLRKDMDSRQKNGEFLSWAAFCFPVEFKPLEDKEDREFQKEKIKELLKKGESIGA